MTMPLESINRRDVLRAMATFGAGALLPEVVPGPQSVFAD
jgi:hypothetical protein